MLSAFVHRVAMCCDMLVVVGSNLTIFKLEPTTPNMSQHIAAWQPNTRNMLRPTMLRYVALACCDRLAGALFQNVSQFIILDEEKEDNQHADKRRINWPPFWNKLYESTAQ